MLVESLKVESLKFESLKFEQYQFAKVLTSCKSTQSSLLARMLDSACECLCSQARVRTYIKYVLYTIF